MSAASSVSSADEAHRAKGTSNAGRLHVKGVPGAGTLGWAELSQWRREPLFTLMEDCRERYRKARDLSDELSSTGLRFQAEGASADAIRSFIAVQARLCDQLTEQLAELMMSAAHAGDGIGRAEIMIEECHEQAALSGLRIDEHGKIMRQPDANGAFAANPMAQEQLGGMIEGTLRYARELDADYRDRLAAIAGNRAQLGESHAAHSPGLPDLPDAGWSGQERAAWWSSLRPGEREALIANFPEVIGNADGIDAASRDRANRILLPRRIAEAEAELRRLREEILRLSSDGEDDKQAAWDAASARLADLREVERVMAEASGEAAGGAEADRRMLLVLDTDAEGTRAAIATGDPDHADHLAVYVPGMGTTVREGLAGSVGHLDFLRATAVSSHGADGGSIAGIAWLGYDAPPGPFAAASPAPARAGAALLGNHLEGLHAARQQAGTDEAHTTVIGHSYGSTTAGMMADTIGDGVVDELIMLGSPGAGVGNASELRIEGGAYVSAFGSHDIVTGLGLDATHGIDPAEAEGITHISSEGPPLLDRGPWGAHSDYLRPAPDGEPTPIHVDVSGIIIGAGPG